MRCYSAQPRDQIFVEDYGFLSSARNIGKNVGRKISKTLTSNYSQILLDHAKQSPMDKTALKRATQRTAGATDDLVRNKFANRIMKVSKTSRKNNPEQNEEEILRETIVPPELSHKIINNLRLKEENYWLRLI